MGFVIKIMIAVFCVNMTCSATTLEQRVDRLYNRMSMAERVAQLRSIYMSELFTPDGKIDEAKCKKLIPDGIGHISQFAMDLGKSPNEQRDMVAQLQKWLIENTPNHIPALVHEEVLSGVNALDATVYPQQIGMACTFNTELAEKKPGFRQRRCVLWAERLPFPLWWMWFVTLRSTVLKNLTEKTVICRLQWELPL